MPHLLSCSTLHSMDPTRGISAPTDFTVSSRAVPRVPASSPHATSEYRSDGNGFDPIGSRSPFDYSEEGGD